MEEVPYDDDEVALVAAATEPAVDDKSPAEERETASASGAKSEAQTNGVLVLALLDKIIGVVDQIQQTQNGLEARQETMEKSVLNIQGELAKLSKNHVGTTDTVNKMLEKVRKVSVNVKTVRTNLEKQAGQIKKLESNENELLKRRNFKVLLYQVCLSECACACSALSVIEKIFSEEFYHSLYTRLLKEVCHIPAITEGRDEKQSSPPSSRAGA